MKTLRILPALFLGAALTACPTAPKPDPIPPSPKVVKFTATPATVTPGTEVTIEWGVTDATKVTIADVDKGAVSGVDDKLSGAVKVVPTGDTLYVLTALNDRGAKATAFVSVRVAGAEADKLLFAVYPPVIREGESASLIWSAPGATAVTITPAGGTALDLMGQVQSGTVGVNPTDTETTYTLDADGQTRTVTVTRAPAIDSLTTSKLVAEPGDMVTVRWTTSHATKVTLSSPGFGTLHETTDAAEVAMGSFTQAVAVLPAGTVLNYVLDITGPGGQQRKVAALAIGKGPVLTEATAPEYAKIGGHFVVAWKAANADAVEVRLGSRVIYQTTSPAQATVGQVELPTPASDTTYTVAAVALPSGTSATRDVTVKPVGDVSINTFTATPATVGTGGSAVTLTWNIPNARRLRIEQRDLLSVVAVQGVAGESGTTTVYPNAPTSTFTLTADNTIDPAVTATADVTVTTMAELQAADGGVIFAGGGQVELGAPVGTEIQGLPLAQPDFNAASTGFDDIAMTGTELTFSNADNATAQFSPWGFETFLFGTRLVNGGTVSVCTNGFMALRASSTTAATPPSTFPGTTTTYDNFLAPFWADLELGPNGKVLWEVKGDAPNRKLIVQWDHVRMVGQATSSLTFQVQVTQTGVITFEYGALDNLPATYTSATAIQGTGGKTRQGTPAAGGSLTFFAPRPFPVRLDGATLPTGGFVKIGNGFAPMSITQFVKATDFGISEVMYSPAATVTAGEWFEVFNQSNVPVDLNGWTIDFGGGNTHTIASSVVVAPQSAVVIGQSTNPLENDGVTEAYAYGTSLAMDDTMGSITLSNGAANFTASWSTGVGGVGISSINDPTKLLGRTNAYDVATGPCSAPVSATFGSQTPLQRGTPGVLSSCFPRLSTIPVSYTEIATTGTPVGFTSFDESTRDLDISSAPIQLQGVSVSQLTISTNGWISATATTTAGLSNKTYPSTSNPLGTVAVFWDDLDRKDATGNIYYQRFAANVDPNNPDPHWVIEWKGYTHWNANDTLDFQAKLFDDGRVEYHYATMTSGNSSNYANGNSATIWLENAAGTGALPFSINQPNITPNMAIRYQP
ncbi:MAG: lamin tail domain-containing protein [Myxococcota bacterium]